MSDAPKLKPCPFCGGSAEIHEGIIYGHYVECNLCQLTLGVFYGSDGEWNGDFDGVGDAFRAWNTRADLHADLIKAADRLAEMLNGSREGRLWSEWCVRGVGDFEDYIYGDDGIKEEQDALIAYQQAKEKLG